MALQGLDRADQLYQQQRKYAEALEWYTLSIDLLVQWLKEQSSLSPKVDRISVRARVQEALRQAEDCKRRLNQTKCTQQRQQQPRTTPPRMHHRAHSQPNLNVSSSPSRPVASGTRRTSLGRPSSTNQRPLSDNHNRQEDNTKKLSSWEQIVRSDLMVHGNMETTTSWDDIAGLESVKQVLREAAILPLERPDLFRGCLRAPRNVLLFGPPGTGKTMLIRAVANHTNSTLFVCTAATLVSKWMGEAEKIVQALFAVASLYDVTSSQGQQSSLIFFDEVDALLSSRKGDGGEHEASRRLKTEIMVQMDGLKTDSSDKKQVLVLACTNCPWDVDSAVLRRFPRRVYVPLPDAEARRGLLLHLLQKERDTGGSPHDLSKRQVTQLVQRTEGFSCADLVALASEAAFGPLRSVGSHLRTATMRDLRPISYRDFDEALSSGAVTRSVSVQQIGRYESWQQEQAAR